MGPLAHWRPENRREQHTPVREIAQQRPPGRACEASESGPMAVSPATSIAIRTSTTAWAAAATHNITQCVHPWARGRGITIEAVRLISDYIRANDIGTCAGHPELEK